VVFGAGDVVRLVLPGGGGYGDPRRRDPALVERDLASEYVTPETARREHGGGAP
jgi:N-methylhydantoinase B